MELKFYIFNQDNIMVFSHDGPGDKEWGVDPATWQWLAVFNIGQFKAVSIPENLDLAATLLFVNTEIGKLLSASDMPAINLVANQPVQPQQPVQKESLAELLQTNVVSSSLPSSNITVGRPTSNNPASLPSTNGALPVPGNSGTQLPTITADWKSMAFDLSAAGENYFANLLAQCLNSSKPDRFNMACEFILELYYRDPEKKFMHAVHAPMTDVLGCPFDKDWVKPDEFLKAVIGVSAGNALQQVNLYAKPHWYCQHAFFHNLDKESSMGEEGKKIWERNRSSFLKGQHVKEPTGKFAEYHMTKIKPQYLTI